jgi:uncharacterized protein (DUF2336 family)
MILLLTPENIVRVYLARRLSELDAPQLGAVRRIAGQQIEQAPENAAVFRQILDTIGDN